MVSYWVGMAGWGFACGWGREGGEGGEGMLKEDFSVCVWKWRRLLFHPTERHTSSEELSGVSRSLIPFLRILS